MGELNNFIKSGKTVKIGDKDYKVQNKEVLKRTLSNSRYDYKYMYISCAR